MNLDAPLSYLLTAQDSLDFARLSGDFNPLHVDAVAARRLQFGGTVHHGIHLVLKALDLATAAGLLAPAQISAIGAVFGSSVRTGTPVDLALLHEAGSDRARLVGSHAGKVFFTARLAFTQALPAGPLPDDAAPEQPAVPLCPDFPATPADLPALAASVPLRLNPALLRALLPALADSPQGAQLAADLLATTRIVGMACPGLHSIYSEFKLKRRQPSEPDLADLAGRMPYAVQRSDPRFRCVRIAVAGGSFDGTLEAFFRAPPVAQLGLDQVCAQVAPQRFAGQHALVVGGSRGLGELAAKVLLAGGARVVLTYAGGREDALRVCAEASALGRDCRAMHLDASRPLPPATAEAISSAQFTHLYHFATPQIAKSPTAAWSAALFDEFCKLYVHGLAELVHCAAPQHPQTATLQVLYPSTVFLDQPEKGLAEYCAAKAAGESLCDHLALLPGVAVSKPRLPRLQTDQNNSFRGLAGAAPMPVVLAMLGALHPDATAACRATAKDGR